MRRLILLGLILILSDKTCFADGAFVFSWNKQRDIDEPTQKAIILYDQGHEDLVLQVKYQGPAEQFGWLVPVPGLPEVRKGSMDCFYELSRVTQKQFGEGTVTHTGRGLGGGSRPVEVIEIKTVGAYEVAVLSAGSATDLKDWLEENGFVFPKEKQDVLDGYIKKHWCFVAIRIDPNQDGFVLRQFLAKTAPSHKAVSASTSEQLANGELHPLIISFDSAKCVFPLAISAVNGKPSEISLYIVSQEPLASRAIFDKKVAAFAKERDKFNKQQNEQRKKNEEIRADPSAGIEARMAEVRRRASTNSEIAERLSLRGDDPNDPLPFAAVELRREPYDDFHIVPEDYFGTEPPIKSMTFDPGKLDDCAKDLPRLIGKSWWLTKQVCTFAPDEMRDLEFEPAISMMAELLPTTNGAAAMYLAEYGSRCLPAVEKAAKSQDARVRRNAASVLHGIQNAIQNLSSSGRMSDFDLPLDSDARGRIADLLPNFLTDSDPWARYCAVTLAWDYWNPDFAPLFVSLLGDPYTTISMEARAILKSKGDPSLMPTLKKLIDDDAPGASSAAWILDLSTLTRQELLHMLSSTNRSVVVAALQRLGDAVTLENLVPLLTNSLPEIRYSGLGQLVRIRDKQAVDRIVIMLRDSNEGIRWSARTDFRSITGQQLGADPAAYEKWWKENRDTCELRPASVRPWERQRNRSQNPNL